MTITLALLVRPWLYQDILRDSPRRWQVIASASALVLIVAFSWVLDRIGRRGKVNVEGWSSVRWIRNAALLLGLLSVAGGFAIRNSSRFISSGDAGKASGKPNIILISMDTVRADHTSLYGYDRDTTPNLRRFAAESTLYRNAISAASWTAPSHASIFTGMYTLRHGVRYNLPNNTLGRLPGAVPTLAEVLAHQGYRTAGVVANYGFLSESLGFGRGFDFYRLAMPWMVFEQSRYPSVLRGVRHRLLPPVKKELVYVNGEKMTGAALEVLDRLAGSQPFLPVLKLYGCALALRSAGALSQPFRGAQQKYEQPRLLRVGARRARPRTDHHGCGAARLDGGLRWRQSPTSTSSSESCSMRCDAQAYMSMR